MSKLHAAITTIINIQESKLHEASLYSSPKLSRSEEITVFLSLLFSATYFQFVLHVIQIYGRITAKTQPSEAFYVKSLVCSSFELLVNESSRIGPTTFTFCSYYRTNSLWKVVSMYMSSQKSLLTSTVRITIATKHQCNINSFHFHFISKNKPDMDYQPSE